MRYQGLSPELNRRFSVDSLDGGLNLCGTEFENNQLTDCENMWFSDGLLRTRPGISTAANTVIYQQSDGGRCLQPPQPINCVFYQNGSAKKLSYFVETDDCTYDCISVFALSADGQASSYGQIFLNRIDENVFYRFDHVVFFTASPTFGCGLYAFVTRKNSSLYKYEVYEANAACNGFSEIDAESFHIPTLYLNGRGNRYTQARREGYTSEAAVIEAESLNLLNDRFHACFSSDGYSYSFYLPVKNLDSLIIRCKIFSSPDEYTEWVIGATATRDTKIFNEVAVTMICDRINGLICFVNNDNEAYAVEKMLLYENNNIQITASKTVPNGLEQVIGCRHSIAVGNKIILYGNDLYPDKIYILPSDKPLYSALDNSFKIGTSGTRIMTVVSQKNHLTVFKKGEIIRLSLTDGKQYHVAGLPFQTDNIIFGPYGIKTVTVHPEIGCDCPDTVRLCKNQLIWLHSDGTVYSLSEQNIRTLSAPVKSLLTNCTAADFQKAFALFKDGYYYLFLGNSVLVTDSDDTFTRRDSQNAHWYTWQLPHGLCTENGISDENILRIFCSDSTARLYYSAAFGQDRDIILTLTDNTVTDTSTEIFSGFSSMPIHFGTPERKKHIDAVYLVTATAQPLEIVTESDNCRKTQRIRAGLSGAFLNDGTLRTLRICPGLPDGIHFRLSVQSDTAFAVSGFVCCYRETDLPKG